NLAYETEAVRFDRDLKDDFVLDKDGNPDFSAGAAGRRLDQNVSGFARANGNRYNVAPSISLPMEASYGYLTPKLKYAYTHYDLDLDSKGKADAIRLQA
ncbi:LPS assembly protein LptD, partial [Pantoea sp. SIMBA_072]